MAGVLQRKLSSLTHSWSRSPSTNVAQFTLTLANQKKAPCSLHASLLTMVSKHLV